MQEKRTVLFSPPLETGDSSAPEPKKPSFVPVIYNWYQAKEVISAVINLLNVTSSHERRRLQHIPPPDNMGVDLLYDLARPESDFADFPHEMTLQVPSQAVAQEQETFQVTIPLPDFLHHLTTAIEQYRETHPLAAAPLQSTAMELASLTRATHDKLIHFTFIHAPQGGSLASLQTLEIIPLPPSEQEH